MSWEEEATAELSGKSSSAAAPSDWQKEAIAELTRKPTGAARARGVVEAPKTNEAYESGRNANSSILGSMAQGLSSVMQGPTMGFGDEIGGAIAAPFRAMGSDKSLRDSYIESRDYLRGMNENREKDSPWFTGITQGMASAPMGLVTKIPGALTTLFGKGAAVTAPASKVASEVVGWLPRALESGRAGTVYGAMSGLGNSNKTDVGGVLLDTALGAATGGIGGTILSPAVNVVDTGVRNVAQRVNNASASQYAREKIAQAFARDAEGEVFLNGLSNPANQALARLEKRGESAVAADAGGSNVRSLLDFIATAPGQTKNQLDKFNHSRIVGRSGRVVDSADKALATDAAGYAESLRKLADQRTADATPLYEQLKGLSFRADDDLVKLIQAAKSAHGPAEELERIGKRVPIDLSLIKAGDDVPHSVLDSLKQSLYDAGKSAYRGGADKLGSGYGSLEKSLREKLDTLSPKDELGNSIYAQARHAWELPSKQLSAVELGRTAMKSDNFEVGDKLSRMSQEELQAFKIGALQALREKVGTQSGTTSLLKVDREPATQEKLKLIFGNDLRGKREFLASLLNEAKMKQLDTLGQGSRTAQREFAAGDLDTDVASGIASTVAAAHAGVIPGIKEGARVFWNRLETPEPVRNQMGQMLLAPQRQPTSFSGKPEARQVIGGLSQIIDDINKRNMDIATTGGSLIGSNIGRSIDRFVQP